MKWLKPLQSHSTVGREKYSGFLLTPGKHFKPIKPFKREIFKPFKREIFKP